MVAVLATWTQAQWLGQSPDDDGEAERLNTYDSVIFLYF